MFKFLLVSILLVNTAYAGKIEMVTRLIGKYLPVSSKKPLNYALKGKKHPKTGVRFSKAGYPRFPAVATCDMRLSWFEINFDKFSSDEKIRAKHFKICSRQLYKKLSSNKTLRNKFTPHQLRQLRNGKTPDGYTWHHEPKKNILTLVDRNTHAATAHSGGFSLYH